MVDKQLFTLDSIYSPLLLLFMISILQVITLFFTHGSTSILYCILIVMSGISIAWLFRNLRINKKT